MGWRRYNEIRIGDEYGSKSVCHDEVHAAFLTFLLRMRYTKYFRAALLPELQVDTFEVGFYEGLGVYMSTTNDGTRKKLCKLT